MKCNYCNGKAKGWILPSFIGRDKFYIQCENCGKKSSEYLDIERNKAISDWSKA